MTNEIRVQQYVRMFWLGISAAKRQMTEIELDEMARTAAHQTVEYEDAMARIYAGIDNFKPNEHDSRQTSS